MKNKIDFQKLIQLNLDFEDEVNKLVKEILGDMEFFNGSIEKFAGKMTLSLVIKFSLQKFQKDISLEKLKLTLNSEHFWVQLHNNWGIPKIDENIVSLLKHIEKVEK